MKIKTFLPALVLLLPAIVNAAPPDSLLPVTVKDPVAYVQRITDSLKKAGTDTILQVYKQCEHCLQVKSQGKAGDKSTMAFVNETAPVYVLWCTNGKYYIKKIDQFGVYKTIERKYWNHFPIYDYYVKNKASIIDKLELTKASTKTPGAGSSGPVPGPKNFAYPVKMMDPVEETDLTSIHILLPNDSRSITISKDKSNPVIDSNDSLAFGNTKKTYYDNFILERNQWKRIIESELFETEFKHLWVKE